MGDVQILFFDLVRSQGRNLFEGVSNTDIFFGRGLEERVVTVVLAPGARLLELDLSVGLPVLLIAKDNEGEVLGVLDPALLDKLGLPGLKGLETLFCY